MSPTRRQVLAGMAALGPGALAGCVGDGGGGGDDDSDDDTEDEEEIHPDLRLNGGKALTSVFPARFVDAETEQDAVEVHWHEEHAHWHAQPLEVPLDGFRSLRFIALDREREPLSIGEDAPYQFDVLRGEDTPADLVEVEVVESLLTVHGTTTGRGILYAQLLNDGEEAWLSPPLRVDVVA